MKIERLKDKDTARSVEDAKFRVVLWSISRDLRRVALLGNARGPECSVTANTQHASSILIHSHRVSTSSAGVEANIRLV